ncbi:MAG: hypothetical protein HY901_36875 [Deltaproteobacteria bacterium]|nr:hypothetical protein [Deltaproteobacteria bacterium]
MQATYPARYRDAHGEIATTIRNHGKTLRMALCGVEFEGTDFDSLELACAGEGADTSRFTFSAGSLCACTLELELPLTVVAAGREVAATLEVRLRLGGPKTNGGIESEDLGLGLTAGGTRLQSRGETGWFEDELADLQRQVPEGDFLKICFGCAWSDYSPAGHGLYGGLACFRGNKAGYAAASTKEDMLRIWRTVTEWVQETYLCPEFERRKPGTGYRG